MKKGMNVREERQIVREREEWENREINRER